MEGATVLIEIASLRYPLELRGRVGKHDWRMFAKGDHWVFYVEDVMLAGGDHLWALTAKYPEAEQMPQMLAIHIADACAKKFEKIATTVNTPPR